jgi:hypothetical protein
VLRSQGRARAVRVFPAGAAPREVVVPKVTIQVSLSEHLMHAYECEAKRRGKRIEELVEKLVNELVREMEREVNDPQGMMS